MIPGVAIATALMPPLCTGWIRVGEWQFCITFFGAFYLYFINTVFISLATFVVVRLLKYPKKFSWINNGKDRDSLRGYHCFFHDRAEPFLEL